MPNYQNGKIYKIHSYQTDLVYYGSTTVQLCSRLTGHKQDLKSGRTVSSKQILQYDDAMITLVELFPCNSKTELESRERFYIQNNQCVNKIVPTRTDAEYYKDNSVRIRAKQHKYSQDHKNYVKHRDYWRRTNPIGILARSYFN